MRYSVIIPTMNRFEILVETVRGCLKLNYNDYEVLVSNNASSDETENVSSIFEDNIKFKYIETPERLSMPRHWEFAMSHASGERVIFLGDDDGISPNLLQQLDILINATGANVLRWNTSLYFHPDWGGSEGNTLVFSQKDSNRIFRVNPQTVLSEAASLEFGMFPTLLKTCFSRDLFRAVEAQTGRMFFAAPDFSCPMLLLMHDRCNYLIIDSTLGFGGRSRNSNAAAVFSNRGDPLSRMEEFCKEFKGEDPFPHHEPKIWSPANANVAGFSFGKRLFPMSTRGIEIDSAKLCSQIVKEVRERGWFPRVVDRHQRSSLKKAIKSLPRSQRPRVAGLANLQNRHALRRFFSKIKRKIYGQVVSSAELSKHSNNLVRIIGESAGFTDGGSVIQHFDEFVSYAQSRLSKQPRDYNNAVEINLDR